MELLETQIKANPYYSCRGQFHQRVYAQLLCPQIPKAKKAALVDCHFYTFGICGLKAAHKMLVKLTPGYV